MTKFSYKAKEGPGKLLEGTIEADSIELAISKIIKKGLTPVDVNQYVAAPEKEAAKKPVKKNAIWTGRKRVSLTDLVIFTRQMSDLVDASVPILRALTISAQQTENQYFKEIMRQMYAAVLDGASFSDALAQHPKIFPSLYVNLVRTGEVSGQLERILLRLADYLEGEQETRNKVKSSLAYPLFILGVGFITIFVLLTFVIPRISVMFDDLNQTLPWPTMVLMSLSSFMVQYWWLIVGGIGISFYYLKKYFSTASSRQKLDEWFLKWPLLGEFIKTVEVGRFARSLGTLLESGVTITTALKSVWSIVDNSVLRNEVKNISEEVANGSSLAAALQKSRFFPPMAVNMISVGEETGKLERGLNKIAETYEKQADRITKTLVSLLGPMVLVFIVAIVGFVVIAMLLPIFQMNLIVQ